MFISPVTKYDIYLKVVKEVLLTLTYVINDTKQIWQRIQRLM